MIDPRVDIISMEGHSELHDNEQDAARDVLDAFKKGRKSGKGRATPRDVMEKVDNVHANLSSAIQKQEVRIDELEKLTARGRADEHGGGPETGGEEKANGTSAGNPDLVSMLMSLKRQIESMQMQIDRLGDRV